MFTIPPRATRLLFSTSVSPMIPQFALRLIVGLSLTWCLLPRSLITSGFFRIQMLVALGLSVLAFLTAGEIASDRNLTLLRGSLIVAALVNFIGSVLWTLERRRSGTVFAVLVLWCAARALVLTQAPGGSAGPPIWLDDASALTSAWSLGALTCAMLLGHWYLTAAGMSLTPLIRATQLALVAVVLKSIVVGVSIGLAPAGLRNGLLHDQFVWTLLRVCAGLAGPLILAAMTFGILRYRNTQSATGVLFAAVILVFIGESAALLLERELHWPL